MAKNEKKEEKKNEAVEIDKNQLLKNLVSEGEQFSPEWLDMSGSDLLTLLTEVKTRKEAFEEIKELTCKKTLQIQQLMGVVLYDDPTAWGNKSQSWAVSLCRLCCSESFKKLLNSNKTLEDIKVFLETCKDK